MQLHNKIQILKGDITKIEVDAIVNAANTSLLGGGGVDGAIHRAGGKAILEDCKKILAKQGGCKTGEAVITSAGNLKAKFVIHTVGPVWNGGGKNEAFYLASCYSKSLQLAVDNNCKSIAFPCISTGVYGYPINEAAKIAVQEVAYFLSQNNTIENIIFVCYDDENFDCVKQYAAEYLPKQAKANNTLTTEEVVAIHLGWEIDGFTMEDVFAVEEKLRGDDPFTIIKLRDIQNFMGDKNFVLPERVIESDYEKISFIYYADCGFDGDIELLSKCINIEKIKIGCSSKGKIEDLNPLAKLKKLKSIDFRNHSISDLSSLKEIESLEKLNLTRNPISSISSIVHLKNITEIEVDKIPEFEVFELLSNSQNASVKFDSLENDEITYIAFWINDWAFKTHYRNTEEALLIAIEAINVDAFKIQSAEKPTLDYRILMKGKLREISELLLAESKEIITEVEYFNEDIDRICAAFKFK